MLYRYVKAKVKVRQPKRKFWKYFSFGCLVLGLIFLSNAFLPILLYEINSRQFTKKLISPVEVLGESSTVVDYSRPNTWFPTAPNLSPQPTSITHYTLSIPKLKINEGIVEINGKDLAKNLVQYPGTALPGQNGNTVIFGHSTLPQFFNPKNYKTIFSTLPTIKSGDEILVNFDGVLYKYQVIALWEVTPEDFSVLEQRYDGEYLTLITCVPPGTYLRRLVVRARLVKF